jgi:hypothetical protein
MEPCLSPVGGGGEADVRGPAVEEPPRLEGGDNRIPECERVGLDLGLVIAVGVVERVAADLGNRLCGPDRWGACCTLMLQIVNDCGKMI